MTVTTALTTGTEITACRLSGSKQLVPILDLGIMPFTGIFPSDTKTEVPAGPLEVVLCPESGLVQLRHNYRPADLYGPTYGYRSGINASMVRHLQALAAMLSEQVQLESGDVVLDIGSNDGTLLGAYSVRSGVRFLGMDPSAAQFRRFYPPDSSCYHDLFSVARYRRMAGQQQAKIITTIAMLYDLAEPGSFVQSIADILASDGVWCCEQSYLPSMLNACAYDAICHEHLEYYGLRQLIWLGEQAGLRLVSAVPTDVNGGSLRAIFAHDHSRYVSDWYAIERLLHEEDARRLADPASYRPFREAIDRHRHELSSLIHRLRAQGRTIFGYGASTKGNVLLHACGLTANDVPCIADANPEKHGRVTPGTGIPIVSEEYAREQRPDYFLVLPWHFRDHIIQREREFLKHGGRLIFPLPTIDVVSA